jgi:hypothetical protein
MSNNGELAYVRETFPAWSIEQTEDGWTMQRGESARVLHAKTLQELLCKLRDSEISRVQRVSVAMRKSPRVARSKSPMVAS